MAAQWQFLMVEFFVACSAIAMLLVVLTLAFWLEHRTPGPAFSHKAIRMGALERDNLKYHDSERAAQLVPEPGPGATTHATERIEEEEFALTA